MREAAVAVAARARAAAARRPYSALRISPTAWLRSTIAAVVCSGVKTTAARATEVNGSAEDVTKAEEAGTVEAGGGGGGNAEGGVEEPDISDTRLVGSLVLPELLRRLYGWKRGG